MLLTVGQLRARSNQAKADRRLQILTSAAAVCAAAGYEELTVSDVAERAGVAKGTVFRYFPTKEDLGRALAGQHLARWADDLDRRLARLPGPPAPDTAARLLVESLAGRRDLLALAARGLVPAGELDETPAAPALVIYFAGVPDTTPEVVRADELVRSLDARIARARAEARNIAP